MTDVRALYEKETAEAVAADRLVQTAMNALRENIERFAATMSEVRRYAPESILDAGCSWGLLGSLLRWNHGYRPKTIVGIDWSESACETAVKVSGYDRAICCDLETWAPEGAYDLVIATEILEHVKTPRAILRKLCQVGKRVLVSFPIEEGEPDGVFHVRKIEPTDVFGWTTDVTHAAQAWFVPAEHGEKPKWMGNHFVLLETKRGLG